MKDVKKFLTSKTGVAILAALAGLVGGRLGLDISVSSPTAVVVDGNTGINPIP